MLELIIAVTLATCISASCSLAEAVLYSIPWSYIERLKNSGNSSGKRLEKLRLNVDQPITAILTLNTVANTAGAAVAGAAAVDAFGSDSLVYFSALFTVIILVFAEIIPKTIGVVYSQKLGTWLASPLGMLVVIFKPVIWMARIMVGFIEQKKPGPATSEEDLLAHITLSSRAGAIDYNEALSMRNILALDKKVVRDIMTPRTVIFSLPSSLTVVQAWDGNKIWPHSRIPVFENQDPEDIVGLVYRREVLESLAQDKDRLKLSDLMKPVQFVLENLTLDRLLRRFLESRTHLFVVLDEYGGLAGVVTLEDVMEEILGREIVDETDEVVDMRAFARQQRKKLVRA